MVSMTKFDKSSVANHWLCVLKEELSGPPSPGTWPDQADARLEVVRHHEQKECPRSTEKDSREGVQRSRQFPGNGDLSGVEPSKYGNRIGVRRSGEHRDQESKRGQKSQKVMENKEDGGSSLFLHQIIN